MFGERLLCTGASHHRHDWFVSSCGCRTDTSTECDIRRTLVKSPVATPLAGEDRSEQLGTYARPVPALVNNVHASYKAYA